jgi:hypothetical protein
MNVNGKMRPVDTIPGREAREMNKNSGEGEFK